MRKSETRVALLALVAWVGVACYGKPVPTTVVPGTTFVLPMPPPTAYGNDTSKSQAIQDVQRGDFVATICPAGNPFCTPTTSTSPCSVTPPTPPPNGYYLATRYVTEVMPSLASTAALNGYLRSASYGGSGYEIIGQGLAFLDVPSYACPGEYTLSIRKRPANALPGVGETIITEAWNITVANAPPGTPTATEATVGSPPNGIAFSQALDLAELVPNPSVHLRLSQAGFTPQYPAAAEIEVTYPTNKVQILGAYQYGHLGLKSMLTWRDDPVAGVVTLSLVDPTRCTQDLRVVFKLTASTPVDPLTEFATSPAAQRLYGLNGEVLTQNPYVIAVDSATNAPLCGT